MCLRGLLLKLLYVYKSPRDVAKIYVVVQEIWAGASNPVCVACSHMSLLLTRDHILSSMS